MQKYEIVIVGGGLAGLTAAIHLSKIGFKVLVIEKNEYPKHKVCGEYISNEVKPYLDWLDVNIAALNPTTINHLQFTSISGKTISCKLPLGGFGISRYQMDHYLHCKAIAMGSDFLQDSVTKITFKEDIFSINMLENEPIQSKIVLGAYGKRDVLDKQQRRQFSFKKTHWLAVKAHYRGNFNSEIVGLYNFDGGYCGISKVEDNVINVCYLADYNTFKKCKNLEHYQNLVLCKNEKLKQFFESATMIFQKPLTISQISFARKKSVENHILMIGDAAGLIHPMCGNGMAMAIHSAKMVSELIQKNYNKKKLDRKKLEIEYQKLWRNKFTTRIQMGRILSLIFRNQYATQLLMNTLFHFNFLLPKIVKFTHGKPLIVK